MFFNIFLFCLKRYSETLTEPKIVTNESKQSVFGITILFRTKENKKQDQCKQSPKFPLLKRLRWTWMKCNPEVECFQFFFFVFFLFFVFVLYFFNGGHGVFWTYIWQQAKLTLHSSENVTAERLKCFSPSIRGSKVNKIPLYLST